MKAIRLPDWTARRLSNEACLYYNLRHPEATIDEWTSPWANITGAILNFLRHEFTDYDAELNGTFDPGKRDALVAEVTKVAFAKYRWLKRDPREMPEFGSPAEEKKTMKPLDRRAARLAEFRSLAQAIQRFLATDCPKERRAEMKQKLGQLQAKIDRDFDIFTPITDEFTKGDFRPTATDKDYDFFGYVIFPNRWKATRVTCPRCRQRVVQTKSPLHLGQNRRMHVLTCYCITGMVIPPPPGKGFITLDEAEWKKLIGVFENSQSKENTNTKKK